MSFHGDRQDIEAAGWRHLLALIDEAAADGRPVFTPFVEKLHDSTVSTRVLYGNFEFRPPFPALRPVTDADDADFAALDPAEWGIDAVRTCSVCDAPVDNEFHQVWVSRRVGTDVLPLLVNACSTTCITRLPTPHTGYMPTPHTGGPNIVQPTTNR